MLLQKGVASVRDHVTLSKKEKTIVAELDNTLSPNEIRRTSSKLIAAFGVGHHLKIKNLPFCMLGDGIEYIEQESGEHVAACSSCTFKQQCKGVVAEKREQLEQAISPLELRPHEIAIEINRACLFKCPFCFYHQFYEKKGAGNVPQEKIFEIVRDAKALGAHTIRLFGGDPILRKDFLDIAAYVRAQGLHVVVNTNAIFRSNEHMRDVVNAADHLAVSLHGCDKESEYALTGRKDLFEKLLVNIKRITQFAPSKLTISTLITTYLFEHFEMYVALLKRLNVTHWGLNRPMFATRDYDWLKFPKTQYLDLAEKVAHIKELKTTMANFPHCFFPEHLRFLIYGNYHYNGIRRLFFDTNGYFKPNASMNYNLGPSLKEAWEKNPFKHIDTQQQVPKTCATCSLYRGCYGGSRTMAQVATLSYSGKDPLMTQ